MSALAELAADVEVARGIGDNNPPEPTPFDAISVHIEDLWLEACNWADGAKIENQDQADAVAKLIEDFRLAHADADNARKDENKPFDEGKAAVQAKYAPLIANTKGQVGKTVKAMAALKATLTPWLVKLDQEKRARELAAQQAAQGAADAAAEAMRAANPDNLAEKDAAELMVNAANVAASAAARAANDKAHAKGDGRAIGLRRFYRPEITDQKVAILHYMKQQPERFIALVETLAAEDVRAGKHTIPGVTVHEETRV